MAQISVDLYYIRLPRAGIGVYGWGPYKTPQAAQEALARLQNLPGPHGSMGTPRIEKETYLMDDPSAAAQIVEHDGFAGRGRQVG